MMKITRRQFLILTAGFASGCQMVGDNGHPVVAEERLIDAGNAGNFIKDGVYSYRDQGFFIVRQGEKLFAISAICTHRRCKVDVQTDRSFYCPCHGSTFDATGHVTEGPARRDLPVFPISTDPQGRLSVKISQM